MDFEQLSYEHDGVRLIGRIARPATPGPHPAVMVMHDARGLGGVTLDRLERLSKLGYVAFASDMYGDGVLHEDAVSGGMLMMALHGEPQKLRDRTVAGFEALAAQPDVDRTRIAVMGFCFGGQCALELARSGADVRAAISYHGLLATPLPAAPGAIKGEVAVFSGARDPYAPVEHLDGFRQEMEAAQARWQLTVYSEAFHAFTDPAAARMTNIPGVGYDELADKLSWVATTTLLEATLRG